MSPAERLTPAFFDRDTPLVARALLGQLLVRTLNGHRLSGLVCETEAYAGPDDEASHAYRLTPRSAIMYGSPGRAYVYFIYGMYFCLNAVTLAEGRPGAVLLRGLIPVEGLEEMRARRHGASDHRLSDGPGKLCAALGIDRALNGADLCSGTELHLEWGPGAPDGEVTTSSRVGVRGDDTARLRPWRFVWRPHDP